MSLFRVLESQWIDELNTKNNAVMKLTDVQFGPGQETTADELASTGKNAKCLMTGINSMYYGNTYLYYNRLDLSAIFANQLIKLKFYPPIDTFYGQLQAFNDYFSAIFTQDDLEDFVIDPNVAEGTCTVTAKSTSRGWIGSVIMAYELATPTEIVMPDILLDGIMTPNDTLLLEQAALRYSALDFVDYAAQLKAFPVGLMSAADITTLKGVLSHFDAIAWQETGAAPYSLEGAEVLFVGEGDAATEWMINYNLKGTVLGVCVIKLSASSTLAVGNLYLHFHEDVV